MPQKLHFTSIPPSMQDFSFMQTMRRKWAISVLGFELPRLELAKLCLVYLPWNRFILTDP